MQPAHLHFRWQSRAARRAAGVVGRAGANRRVPGGIICLRLSCELGADIAGALGDAVSARLAAATGPTDTVVLDLSATAAIDDQAGAAIQSLQRRLADLTIRLRLVASRSNVYAALQTEGTGIGPDALHTSVRTAVLAAHADRPGPASVTPALRVLLTQPPELLSLAGVPGRSDRDLPVPDQRASLEYSGGDHSATAAVTLGAQP
jgi:anti-anti-sigma regulatory factor